MRGDLPGPALASRLYGASATPSRHTPSLELTWQMSRRTQSNDS